MKCAELKNAFGPIPDDCYKALMITAHGVKEEVVVKRKLTVALVLCLALLLMVGAALALASWRDTARQIVEIEQTDGYFENWPLEKKSALVGALVQQGYVEKTEAIAQLLLGAMPEEEAGRLADGALVAFTRREVSEISFMVIMQAAWGPFSQWTKEEQAWYSQLWVDMGLQGEDHTLYVLPEGPVDEPQAIAIARREVAKGFGVTESVLDAYELTTSFQVPEFAEEGDDQPYWYVEFVAPEAMPEDRRVFGAFWVFIHPDTGDLLEPIEEEVADYRAYWDRAAARDSDPLIQEMRSFAEMYDSNPSRMSLEAKALWSQRFRNGVLERIAKDPEYFGWIDVAMAAFEYGLPDDKAISQEEAFIMAETALLEQLVEKIGREEEEAYFYKQRYDVYYDITDPQRPLWKFFFCMPNEWVNDEAYAKKVREYYGENDERLPNIKVEVNAYTGEVHRAFTIDFADINSAQEYQEVL